jgi:superfamily II DNA/RNA helicase
MVTDEMSEQSIFVNINAIEEIDNRFISMTTDIFQNLSTKFFDIFLQRIQQSKIIVFDEQHIYMDSKNFREKVVKVYEYLLYRYEGKVLFMSGTPVIPQDIQLNIITAKVPKIAKSIINYSKNPFSDESEMMEHIKEQTVDGSVMVYCNSKTRVEEVNALLIKNGIDCFSMTSIEMKENNEIIKEKRIKSGNYAYISTTKATTGITIKNLKGIYQYGTIYSSNTFIQLLGRLRNGGFYIYICPKFESRREHFLQNQMSATETPTPTHPHSSLLPNRLSTTPILLA